MASSIQDSNHRAYFYESVIEFKVFAEENHPEACSFFVSHLENNTSTDRLNMQYLSKKAPMATDLSIRSVRRVVTPPETIECMIFDSCLGTSFITRKGFLVLQITGW